MRKLLERTFTIIGISIIVYLIWIRPDYKWSQKIFEKRSNEEWIKVTQENTKELFKPWTIFKAPVTQIWFAHKTDLLRIDSAIIVGHLLTYSRENERTEGYSYLLVINTLEYGTYYVENADELKKVNFQNIKWNKQTKGSPQGDIIDYFKSKNKKYTMVSIFGDVVDVSNLIITGLYSSKDTFPQVFEIVNNKPYKPSISDEKIIRDGITEWLFRIYPYRVYSLDSSFYKSVKYTSSQLGFFDNIQDNYSIKILPFKEMDSILIEFDFPRFTIPSEYLKKDEIRIHN